MTAFCKETWNIPAREVRAAVHAAWNAQMQAKADVRAQGRAALNWMRENGKKGIVLAGRPYHVDPEIHHGIPELIASYGLAVLSEDSLPLDFDPQRPVRVNDQWVYHSRLYSAAEFVRGREDLELIQLNSFGCGLDAVTTDQVCEILENSGKLYTVLKIDEVNNLGAVRIRVRSLLAAMALREEQGIHPHPGPVAYHRTEFTKAMLDEGYTILAPQMSPIHFDILEPVFRKYGYHVVILDNDNRAAIDMGLKYVNNDACFPSMTAVGQIMEAVLSGRYDTHRLAVMMNPDRRLLPGLQLCGLHPPGSGQSRAELHPRHLPQRQRDGEKRGLCHQARDAAGRGQGSGVRRSPHAVPLPGAAL